MWKVCVRIKELSHQLFSLEEHMKEPDYNNPRDSFLLWTRIPGLQSCSLHIQDSHWLLQDFCRSPHAREMFLYSRDGYKQLCLPFLSATIVWKCQMHLARSIFKRAAHPDWCKRCVWFYDFFSVQIGKLPFFPKVRFAKAHVLPAAADGCDSRHIFWPVVSRLGLNKQFVPLLHKHRKTILHSSS